MRREYQRDREASPGPRREGQVFQEYPKWIAVAGHPQGGVVVRDAAEERAVTGAPVPEPTAPESAAPARDPLSGQIIRAARALLGWNQSELADLAGVSLPTLHKIESVDAMPEGWPSVAAVERVLIEAGVSWRASPEECGVALRK